MFANGVSENVLVLSMRSPIIWNNRDEYTETHISKEHNRDVYEKENYPDGVWLVRLETKRLKGLAGGPDSAGRYRCTLGRFRSHRSAQAFIEARCAPLEVPPKVYSEICNCLSWKYMIDYKQCKGIIFEQCRNCGNPTKEIFKEPLNKLIFDDFDLDEFLAS